MIYLDHAAATPVSQKVLKAMEPYFTTDFFNPSAAYLPAKKVAADYEAAKAQIAHAIGAKATDLVVTGSATEANNLAFTAVSPTGEILCLATEHASVLKLAQKSKSQVVKVHPSGLINLDDLKEKINDQTELISVALVNNELGTIQPLSEIARLVRAVRLDRLRRGIKRPLHLHSDASQALNLLDVNVARLGVDLLTISAAKVYGPKGVGALYVSHDVNLSPITFGGGQERGLRSGTENVPGVIGFAAALTEAKAHLKNNREKYQKYKKLFLSELSRCEGLAKKPDTPDSTHQNTATSAFKLINHKHSLDNFIVLCYNGIDGERLVYLLEEQGVYVATGAACAASKGEKSHVLAAIGLTESEIAGSLRLTLGKTNTEEQMVQAARLISAAANSERERING